MLAIAPAPVVGGLGGAVPPLIADLSEALQAHCPQTRFVVTAGSQRRAWQRRGGVTVHLATGDAEVLACAQRFSEGAPLEVMAAVLQAPTG